MDFVELFLPVIRDLVILVVVSIAGYALKFWKDLQLEHWIKDLVIDAVLFVQEKYWDLSGVEKFDQAKGWLIAYLNSKGVKVDMDWLEGMIDAAVKELRAEFGEEEWYRNDS